MSNTKDGGPAFPVPEYPFADGTRYLRTDLPGMSLRDYFAAKALPECMGWGEPEDVTRRAYEYADAMLKAREA